MFSGRSSNVSNMMLLTPILSNLRLLLTAIYRTISIRHLEALRRQHISMSIETTRVEELGTRLGEAITELPEYQAFIETKEDVEAANDAQKLIEEFERAREEFLLARQAGTATQADLQQLQSKQEELHSIPEMESYLQAKTTLSERLAEINSAISDPLAIDFSDETSDCCAE